MQLKIRLLIANEIPDEICADWSIYGEILFHVMQNAVKFSRKDGTITIVLSYYPVNLLAAPGEDFQDRSNYMERRALSGNQFGFLVT